MNFSASNPKHMLEYFTNSQFTEYEAYTVLSDNSLYHYFTDADLKALYSIIIERSPADYSSYYFAVTMIIKRKYSETFEWIINNARHKTCVVQNSPNLGVYLEVAIKYYDYNSYDFVSQIIEQFTFTPGAINSAYCKAIIMNKPLHIIQLLIEKGATLDDCCTRYVNPNSTEALNKLVKYMTSKNFLSCIDYATSRGDFVNYVDQWVPILCTTDVDKILYAYDTAITNGKCWTSIRSILKYFKSVTELSEQDILDNKYNLCDIVLRQLRHVD